MEPQRTKMNLSARVRRGVPRQRKRLLVAMFTLLIVLAWQAARLGGGGGNAVDVFSSVEEWKEAMEMKEKEHAPVADAVSLSQIVFLSCNRHDRAQVYWGFIAAATQCEITPVALRATSEPCKRLYTGRTPLIFTTTATSVKRQKPDIVNTTAEGATQEQALPQGVMSPVPLGACGAVVDSPLALQYRQNSVPVATAKGKKKRKTVFGNPGEAISGLPPVDALVWLGDAIYADKRPDGRRISSFGSRDYPMRVVENMWTIQRNAPEYRAFRETCLLPTSVKVVETLRKSGLETMGKLTVAGTATTAGGEEQEEENDDAAHQPTAGAATGFIEGGDPNVFNDKEDDGEGAVLEDPDKKEQRENFIEGFLRQRGIGVDGRDGLIRVTTTATPQADEDEDGDDDEAENGRRAGANMKDAQPWQHPFNAADNPLHLRGGDGPGDGNDDENDDGNQQQRDAAGGGDDEEENIAGGGEDQLAPDTVVGRDEDYDFNDLLNDVLQGVRRTLADDDADEDDGIRPGLTVDEDGHVIENDEDGGNEEEAMAGAVASNGSGKRLAAVNDPGDEEEVDVEIAAARSVVVGLPNAIDRGCNVFGTWDDHDMGRNDAGKEYPYKNYTQKFFLDFLEAPPTDPRRTRPGVYTFHTIDFHEAFSTFRVARRVMKPATAAVPPTATTTTTPSAPTNVDDDDDDDGDGGNAGAGSVVEDATENVIKGLRLLYKHAVCLILLDVRSFRDPANVTLSGDMLGEEQWAWLAQRLANDVAPGPDGAENCALTLIGGGVQLILDEKPTENWAAFPGSRDRLFWLLRTFRVERVAFLTGDVHMGEIGVDFSSTAIQRVLGFPIVEATSSGLTHSANPFPGFQAAMPTLFASRRRVGIYVNKNFGTVRLSVGDEHAKNISYGLRNVFRLFGDAQLDRKTRRSIQTRMEAAVNVTFTIFSIARLGQPALRLTFPLEMLTYEKGSHYLYASAEPRRGLVRTATAKTANRKAAQEQTELARLSQRTSSFVSPLTGKVENAPNYPSTAPTPFITSVAVVMQWLVFPDGNLTHALLVTLYWGLFIGFLVFLGLLLYLQRRVHRRIRRRISANKAGAAAAAPGSDWENTPGIRTVANVLDLITGGKDDEKRKSR